MFGGDVKRDMSGRHGFPIAWMVRIVHTALGERYWQGLTTLQLSMKKLQRSGTLTKIMDYFRAKCYRIVILLSGGNVFLGTNGKLRLITEQALGMDAPIVQERFRLLEKRIWEHSIRKLLNNGIQLKMVIYSLKMCYPKVIVPHGGCVRSNTNGTQG